MEIIEKTPTRTQVITNQKRILFATVPGDGHVNPLTSLAVHLKSAGYDVRWYTAVKYQPIIEALGIPFYPLQKAFDLSAGTPEELFPERHKIKGAMARLSHDLINGFIKRGPEYFEDILAIHRSFPFDLMVCDCMFTAIPFVRELLQVPVLSIGVLPLTETSRDLPPAGMGLTPASGFFGRQKQHLLRFAADRILFRKANRIMADTLRRQGIRPEGSNLLDCLVRKSTLLLQSGTPGFEYRRSDLGTNVRFIGPLLPHQKLAEGTGWLQRNKPKGHQKIVLVTKGTVETNVEKLLVPALEVFKDSDCWLIVTTGGSSTAELRRRYPHENITIEDFIPFYEIMPFADAYVTNGGYGGVMLAVQHGLPLVVAGVHEGKIEICARVGYFGLGVNLKTETPTATQVKLAVQEVLTNNRYRSRTAELRFEFSQYDPARLVERHVEEVLAQEA